MASTSAPEHDSPASAPAGGPFGRAWTDVAEMIELRRKLAEAEIASDVASGKRLAVLGSFGAVLALAGLPLLLVALAFELAARTNLAFAAWLAILGGPLVLIGVAVTYSAWQRFRREFLALSATWQELQEDLQWVREWLSNSD